MYQLRTHAFRAEIRDLEADMTVAVFFGADAAEQATARLLDYATDPSTRPVTGRIDL